MQVDTVQVSESDALFAQEEASHIGLALQALGEELTRHEAAKAALLARHAEATQVYHSHVTRMTRQYIKDPGRWDYRPDIGAFVGVPKERT